MLALLDSTLGELFLKVRKSSGGLGIAGVGQSRFWVKIS
jgi:hypothetical protein